jgi:hypothetical protein
MLLRALLLIVAALLPLGARAAFPSTSGGYYWTDNLTLGFKTTAASVCSEIITAFNNGQYASSGIYEARNPRMSGTSCLNDQYRISDNVLINAGLVRGTVAYSADWQSCPDNSTMAAPGYSTSPSTCTCNATYTESGSGASTTCQPPAGSCGSGGPGSPVPGEGTGSRIVNMTTAWARTPTPNSPVAIQLTDPAGTTQCSNSCEYIVGSAPGDIRGCYRSQEQGPNGMYRVSCDFVGTSTGNSCTMPSDGQANPEAPEPPCLGEEIVVPNSGGRTLCVIFPGGTPSIEPDSPSSSGEPEVFGNPPAGNVPSTGPGSGSGPARTPTSGEGGNEGGGSSAAAPSTDYAGPGGSGGGSGGEGGDTFGCGLPDSAPCKIDETGTTDGSGSQTGSESGLDGAMGTHSGVVSGWGNNTQHAPEWTWTFALPAACSPVPITAFAPFISSIDVCQFQPIIHDLMSVVWIAAAIFACTAMVFRTLNAG